jgi:hypothetical protein
VPSGEAEKHRDFIPSEEEKLPPRILVSKVPNEFAEVPPSLEGMLGKFKKELKDPETEVYISDLLDLLSSADSQGNGQQWRVMSRSDMEKLSGFFEYFYTSSLKKEKELPEQHESADLASEVGATTLLAATTVEQSGEKARSPFEYRLDALTQEIAKLPDTTSHEVQLNPSNPESKVRLEDAMGWKLHLNFDAQDPQIIQKINEVLSKLAEAGAIKTFKIGEGGGKEWGQPGKESTVYVGSRDKTKIVAEFLSSELEGLLLTPEGDALNDDIVLAKNIMGRFNPQYDREFHQYGGGGIPYLKEEYMSGMWLPAEEQPAFYAELALKSRARLIEKYGAYFTGTK